VVGTKLNDCGSVAFCQLLSVFDVCLYVCICQVAETSFLHL